MLLFGLLAPASWLTQQHLQPKTLTQLSILAYNSDSSGSSGTVAKSPICAEAREDNEYSTGRLMSLFGSLVSGVAGLFEQN